MRLQVTLANKDFHQPPLADFYHKDKAKILSFMEHKNRAAIMPTELRSIFPNGSAYVNVLLSNAGGRQISFKDIYQNTYVNNPSKSFNKVKDAENV